MRQLMPRGFWLVALTWLLAVKVIAFAAPATADPKAANDSPAEKNRKLMERTTLSIEFSEQPLQTVLNQLTEQTKLKFVLDRATVGQVNGNDPDMPISAKLEDVSLRSGLRTILTQYGLSYVLIEDMVLVTTEEMAQFRQIRQPVNVDWDDVPLDNALKQLARSSASNLVLDPRVTKEARTKPVSLRLNDVALETVVRIMAEMGDLKTVRMGNVLFVTTKDRARDLRDENDNTPAPAPPPNVENPRIPPGILPGPGLPVPPGVKIINGALPALPPAPAPPPPNQAPPPPPNPN